MPTQSIAGYHAKLAVSTDGGTTYNDVGEVRDITLTLSVGEIEATSHDSGGWKEFIPGNAEWTAEAEGLYVSADAGQDAVYSALTGKTTVKLRFRPKTGAGLDQFTGDALITGWSLSGPNEDAAATSITFRGTGALTRADQ